MTLKAEGPGLLCFLHSFAEEDVAIESCGGTAEVAAGNRADGEWASSSPEPSALVREHAHAAESLRGHSRVSDGDALPARIDLDYGCAAQVEREQR